jgi:hypothetical protein
MSNTTELPDGWYKVTDDAGGVDFERVEDGCCDYGEGTSVAQCLKWGYTFEPAVCMTKTEHNALLARVAELERELASQQIPDDVRGTIRTVLTVASYNPSGNRSGIFDRINKALAWLDAQPKEQP